MAHYAKVVDAVVVNVVVADDDFLDIFKDPVPGLWLKVSYNTVAGTHKLGGEPVRMNFPSIGYHYNSVKDAFYSPTPHQGWVLDEETFSWVPPHQPPSGDQLYIWSDKTGDWEVAPFPEKQGN